MTGETERDVSAWTTDVLRVHILALFDEKDRRYEERFAASQTALTAALAAERTAREVALAAQKEAVLKAEAAGEKRFELLNELRTGVATKDQLDALEKIVSLLRDDVNGMRGRGAGLTAGWGYLIAAVGMVAVLISIFVR